MRTSLRKISNLLGVDRRWRWALVAALALVESVLEIIGAFLVVSMLTTLTGEGQNLRGLFVADFESLFPDADRRRLLLIAATTVASFFVVHGVYYIVQTYVQNRVAHNAGVRLAQRLLKGYLRMPYAFHLRRNSAELIRNIYNSSNHLVGNLYVPLVYLVADAFLVIGILIALTLSSPLATGLAVLVLAPVVFLLIRLVRKHMTGLGRVAHETGKTALKHLQEGINGIREVKLLHRERYFLDRFTVSRRDQARSAYVRNTFASLPQVVMQTMLVFFIMLFLILTVATGRPLNDTIPVLGLFAYAGMRILPSVNRMISNINSLRFAGPAINDIDRELRMMEARVETTESASEMGFRDRITCQNVSFSYGEDDERVLNDVNLTIEAGSFVGIVGPTGSGKTTLMDVLMGLLAPTSGSVTVDGADIERDVRAWQRNLGVVPQFPFLLDDTLRHNIAFGVAEASIDDARLETAIEIAQLDAFVASLPEGLETLLGERGVRLSGGQRQRVAIARALYNQPSVLLFDEATSALDNVTESELIRQLEDLRGGQTVVTIAHRLTTVQMCDRIFVLEEGRVVDEGTFDELRQRNELFREVAG